MAPTYFRGLRWHQITREERVFCAELEHLMRSNPDAFVSLLKDEANVPAHLTGPWDTAFEVCFYRDYLHAFNPAQKKEYSPKRTFDIAIFGSRAIIIIEAKVAQSFCAIQAKYFEEDVQNIRSLLGEQVEVFLVALASQANFDNYERYGKGPALAPFGNRRLSWQAVARLYPNSAILKRACVVYEKVPIETVGCGPSLEWRDFQSGEVEIARLEEHIERVKRAIELLRGSGSN